MKKNIGKIFTLVLLACLTSCNDRTSDNGSTNTSSNSSSSSSSSQEVAADITESDLEKGQTTYTDANGETQDLNVNTLYVNSGNPHLNPTSSGGQHVFVAPFAFQEDTTDSKWIKPTDALLEKIKLTFTGSQEELTEKGGQISVSDFYKKSSYGKANFECDVMPTWITYNDTAAQFTKDAASSGAGVYAAEYCRTWYLAEYAKENHGALGADAHPFSYYDADGNGYMDLMWVVYAYPYNSSDTSFWWAYVTYTNNSANMLSPTVKTLGWASTNFMTEKSGGYDSHTFIHETGHTFGLNDYYDYNNTWKPMGSVDYMDSNVGDHNAYSKFALGWSNPYILKESDLLKEDGTSKTAVITLRAFTNTGDSLVLASPDYNGTAFDEYLILELDGPTGLAKKDYTAGYNGVTGFTKPGIRVLHVDARTHSGKKTTYLKSADEIGQTGKDILNDNSYSGRSKNAKADGRYWPKSATNSAVQQYFTEVSLVESTIDEDNSWMNSPNYVASNSSLFRKNDYMDLSTGWGYYMPSKSNLWDKAKVLGNKTSEYTIDETVTCNYFMTVLDIQEDADYGYVAKIKITLNS